MPPRRMVRWIVSALVVVAVIAAIRLMNGSDTVERDGLTFASQDLGEALERNAAGPDVRVIASFEDNARVKCRAFLAVTVSGIACHERGGWHLRVLRDGVSLDDPAALSAAEASLRQAAARMSTAR